jgi:general secretion pathway protein M
MSHAALPTGRQGQLLALALLLAAVGAIYLFAAAPLLELYAERATAVENAHMLVPRLKAAADELPGLRARAAELRAMASTHTVTLGGSSDAIASANLQSHIAELAAAGVTIASTESLPTETRDGYRRIGLRYALSGPYETLMKLLAKLDAATPPLVVDNLSIHGVMRRPGTPAASALDAGLDLYGFRNNENLVAAKP